MLDLLLFLKKSFYCTDSKVCLLFYDIYTAFSDLLLYYLGKVSKTVLKLPMSHFNERATVLLNATTLYCTMRARACVRACVCGCMHACVRARARKRIRLSLGALREGES